MRILALVGGLALAALVPGEARASIDDDWALVNNCRELAAFQARYGPRNRYTRFIPQRSKALGCVASPGPRVERTEPPRPQRKAGQRRPVIDQAPLLRDEVVLAAAGGDADTLALALRKVKRGGLIRVRPGRYPVSGVIDFPVRIEGQFGRWADTVLVGRVQIVVDSSSEVRLANLTFVAPGPGNFLSIYGGMRCTSCALQSDYTLNTKSISGDPIYVGTGGSLNLFQSKLSFPAKCPSDNCYSVSFGSQSRGGTMTESVVEHAGFGVFLGGGQLEVAQSRFVGAEGTSIWQSAPATLRVSDSAFTVTGSPRFYTLYVQDGSKVTLLRNAFYSKRASTHLFVEGKPIANLATVPGGNVVR